MRKTFDFNKGWKFLRGDVINAYSTDYLTDHFWPSVDLPHDWSIRGPFRETNAMTMRGGYLPAGIGWYRKQFELSADDAGKRVIIRFEGIYQKSDVYVNGHHVGYYPNGFQSFHYDITPFVTFGEAPNLIAVRVDNSVQPGARFYTGSGIYRKVELDVLEPVHVAPEGTFVYCREVDPERKTAVLAIHTDVSNHTDGHEEITLRHTVNTDDGVLQSFEKAVPLSGNGATHQCELAMTDVELWDTESPHLYSLCTELIQNDAVVDAVTTPFGIRKIEFTRQKGFLLNNRQVKLKGVCLHHDNGSLGAEAWPRAEERKIELVKAMGANAIRTSHNPMSREFLDICDRMGMLVMCEAFDEWKLGKMPGTQDNREQKPRIDMYGYHLFWDDWHEHDLRVMLRKDRNHPSIVLWSIGNEIREVSVADPSGPVIAHKLQDICHEMDPSRDVTCACLGAEKANENGFADVPDVMGYNYSEKWYFENFENYPQRRFIGSETTSHPPFRKRGTYDFDSMLASEEGKFHDRRRLDVSESSMRIHMENDCFTGLFIWTGMDYLGEPTPYSWPSRSSYFGLIDLAGFPKDSYYFYKSQWSAEPVLHILPHWNLPEYAGKEVPVFVYTNADEVELFVNDKSLGRQQMPSEGPLHLEWMATWEPGTIHAVGYKNGQEFATASRTTTGPATSLDLETDRDVLAADTYDLAFITCRIKDADGHVVPTADNRVCFSITGPGEILSVDNGDPEYIGDLRSDTIPALSGMCLVAVRAHGRAGDITVTAKAESLESHAITLQAE